MVKTLTTVSQLERAHTALRQSGVTSHIETKHAKKITKIKLQRLKM